MQKIQKPLLVNKDFQNLYYQFQDFYNSKKYFELINLYEHFLNSYNYLEHCFIDFNIVVDITLYVALACFNLNEYEKAKKILTEFEDFYLSFKRRYCFHKERLNKKDYSTIPEFDSKILVGYMNDTLREFNCNSRIRFYNNLGYACYKCEQYDEAIKYYKKTLSIKPNNIQLIVGYHQAVYYRTSPHCLKETDRINIINDINRIKKIESSYDTYLAIGKLYYFLGEFSTALNYINIAISYLQNGIDTCHKEISAYDWISRIAYKQKQYSTASIFYEKIIDKLVEDTSNNLCNHEEIHPKPELYKMLNFLNETKQFIADRETSNLNKSIWAGIFITTIFGLIDCYKNIGFSKLYCFAIGLFIFILGCIIVKNKIKYLDVFPNIYKRIKKSIKLLKK